MKYACDTVITYYQPPIESSRVQYSELLCEFIHIARNNFGVGRRELLVGVLLSVKNN